MWGGRDRLYLMIEGTTAIQSLLDDGPLVVKLVAVDGGETEVEIGPGKLEHPEAVGAVGRVAEISLPWDGAGGLPPRSAAR